MVTFMKQELNFEEKRTNNKVRISYSPPVSTVFLSVCHLSTFSFLATGKPTYFYTSDSGLAGASAIAQTTTSRISGPSRAQRMMGTHGPIVTAAHTFLRPALVQLLGQKTNRLKP